jgi:hypothetical protein
MSSTTAHDAALAYLYAQHVTEQAEVFRQKTSVVVKVTMSPEPSKKVAPKKVPAPIHGAPTMQGMVMPERGSLDAKGFMLEVRNAGRRINQDGFPYTDQREVRGDIIKAIHAFMYETRKDQKVHVGYDPTRDFGSQETAARMLASREIKGAPSVSHIAAPSRSFSGYVAGMPDSHARRLADLQGREMAAVDAMLAHQKEADDTSRPQAARTLSQGLAEVERERLSAIRADILALL